MNKKLISFFLSLSVLTSSSFNVTLTSHAENTIENSDLKALADSFGAGTDCLNIQNYIVGDMEHPVVENSVKDFLSNCSNIYFGISPKDAFYSSLKGGSCVGISLLEILAHNGLISPSDIKPDAEYMNDIQYTADVGKYITDYQVLQCHQEMDLYTHWLRCRKSSEEKVAKLLEDAETATENGKYFFISFFTPTFGHAITGIGITDGLWTFDGVDYDKCILTLDSNVVNQLTGEKVFSEKTCIYINSDTKQFCIPAYDCNSENDSDIFSIADEKLLNYRSTVKPSDSFDTDISLINKFMIYNNNQSDFSITVTNPDGTTYDGIDDSYTNFMTSATDFYYFLDGSSFHMESKDAKDNESIFLTHIINERRQAVVEATGDDASFDIDDNQVKVNSLNNTEIEYGIDVRFNEGEYNFSPHYWFYFNGITDSEVWVEQTDEGMIISSDNGVKCFLYSWDIEFDEDGKPVKTQQNQRSYTVTAADSIMVSFDTDDELIFKTDSDGDGVYESIQQKGDANADGVINASDSSQILSGYADASSGKTNYLNKNICDYNSDGVIDASDASAVLAYYADISSGKIN